MNDKHSYLHSQGTGSMKEKSGGISDRGWGQLLTDENERRDDKNMLDNHIMFTFKTEESESNELNQNMYPSSGIQGMTKLSKLIQKHSIVEEEDNNSDDLNDSQIIRIDSEYISSQQHKRQQVYSGKIIEGNVENNNEQNDCEQDSYQPSDNIEFHSNLDSLERVETEQKQQKNTKSTNVKSEMDQGINFEMVQIGINSNKTIKGTGGATTHSRNQMSNQIGSSSLRQPNRSLTAIESQSPNKLIKIDTPNSKKIRQIKTSVEEDNKKTLLFTNKMNTSIIDLKQNDNQSNEDVQQLKAKLSMRRGGSSAVENPGNGQMSRAQKRKTFLNLRGGTAKIKNFFSRTFTEQGPSVLGLLLNAWRFISSLKRVSTIWRPNMVTVKQLELIDDSTHFDINQNPSRKRKKLFGTSFSLSKEGLQKQYTSIQGRKKQEESKLMKWMLKTLKYVPIINPQSQILYVWDTIHSLFIILNLLVQPIEFVTYTHMESEYDALIWKLFPYVCFTIFIVHIILNFNIGFYQRGICIMDRKQVMTNYFKIGFAWDLLALLPIIDSLAQFQSAWRIVNVFIVCKYITLRSILGKYLELFQLQNQVFIPTFIKLLKVGFLVLFQAHLFACLFLGLANLEKSYNLTDITWIEHYGYQQQSYKHEGNRLTDETVFSKYIYAFYWSVTTMTTTGYGDISASNNYEATFTAFSMIIAGGVFAYSFNSIGFIVSDLNKRNSEFQKDMSLISKYLKNINIKRSLQIEVTKYIEYKYRAEAELSTKEEKEVLDKLGPNIRDKITMSANIQLIKQVPFLINNFSRKFLRRLALHLQKETYLNNEVIFEENDFYATHNPNLYGQQIYQQQQNIPLQQIYQQQYPIQYTQPAFYNNNPTFQNLQYNMAYPQQPNNQFMINQQQQNIQGSQSIQLQSAIGQYYGSHQQFGINSTNQVGNGNNAQNNPNQYNSPQVNSYQALPNNLNGLQIPNHVRKLSGSQMQPNLMSNLVNQNNFNINNVNSPHQMNMNTIQNTPNYQRNSAQQPNSQNPFQYQQQNLNALTNNDLLNNQNLFGGNNLPQSQSQNFGNQNISDDYYYVQTLQQSQSDISFYIVERGTIQLYTKCFKYINEDETTKPIKELKKGDNFGELSFFTEKPRCASAKSIGPSSVLSIKKKDFIKLLKEYPSDYETYCQIHDEIVNNNNLDTLQIRCYSCDRQGHTILKCNKVHFQPDKEKVILTYNYKESEQFQRNKDVWRRVQKFKSLGFVKEITYAQKKIENIIQNQSQHSAQPNQQQQQQSNFTAYFNNHAQSNTSPQPSPFNPTTNGNNNRSGNKKLTLRQLQTLQTQIVDQDVFLPPSPLRYPQQNTFAFNFQNLNGNQGFQNQNNNLLQTQQTLNLNTQQNNQRSSFNDQIQDISGPLQTPPQQNYLSSFQSRIRGSHNKDLIIFEDDNETPIGKDSTIQLDKKKFVSPTTVDTIGNAGNPSINSIGIQSNPHHKKSLETGYKINTDHGRGDSILNNAQLNIQMEQKPQFRSSFAEGHRSHNQSVSFNTLDIPKVNYQTKSLDRPPQQTKALIKDIAAALGDSFDKSMSSNDDQNNSDQSSDNPQFMRQKAYRHPGLNKQKSFTTETTPQNQKILKKINEMYQNIGIPAKQSRFLQKNILFQTLQNTILQNLEEEGVIDLDDEPQCGDFENTEIQKRNRKLTNFITSRMVAKKEMIFDFPSLNTDRMKNFKAYFINFNCSAVLERLANYKPNAFNKRNRLYHIYYRDTIKKGFQKNASFNIVTPANSRISNLNQMSKIANMIMSSNLLKDGSKKKTTQIKEKQPVINKKLSIIESKLPHIKSQMMQSQHFKIRSNTLYNDESDDEF